MHSERRRTDWRSRLGGLAALAAACAAPAAAGAAEATPAVTAAELDTQRAALEQWVATRRLISQERQEWRTGQEFLGERIQLVQREQEGFRTRTAETRAEIGVADTKLAELQAQNGELQTATAGLADAIARLEQRVRALTTRLPAPLRDRLKPLSQRVPADPAKTRLGLSERFQNVVGILNEVNKASRELTVVSEVRALPGGTNAEVTVVYVGIGTAYYASPNGGIAGVGVPAAEGWQWTPSNALATAIADMIGIQRNERPAAYVALPLDVR